MERERETDVEAHAHASAPECEDRAGKARLGMTLARLLRHYPEADSSYTRSSLSAFAETTEAGLPWSAVRTYKGISLVQNRHDLELYIMVALGDGRSTKK